MVRPYYFRFVLLPMKNAARQMIGEAAISMSWTVLWRSPSSGGGGAGSTVSKVSVSVPSPSTGGLPTQSVAASSVQCSQYTLAQCPIGNVAVKSEEVSVSATVLV